MQQSYLEKKIKKNIYGKPQSIKAIFPTGLGAVALDEVKDILASLWFPQKTTPECFLLKNSIRIDNIHMFSVMELLMRSQCLSDIRLVIFESKTFTKSAFKNKCSEIDWQFYLDKTMSVKIKVKSVASNAFHETGLKEILSEILSEYVATVVNENETTSVYADLYKDKLSISISLAGNPLYKRAYRGVLSASAPLREDIAACCIRKALQFAGESFVPDQLIVPFSGTGTFIFEYLLSYFNFAPALLQREYALEKMPLFRLETFKFLLKKAREHCFLQDNSIEVYCADTSEKANAALLENVTAFKNLMIKNNFVFPEDVFSRGWQYTGDFFAIDVANFTGKIFMPLNPPYGVRLGKHSNTAIIYKKIAEKINDIARVTKNDLLGLILCPDEQTWSAFAEQLACKNLQTYHMTQGGLDVRVCQFYLDAVGLGLATPKSSSSSA